MDRITQIRFDIIYIVSSTMCVEAFSSWLGLSPPCSLTSKPSASPSNCYFQKSHATASTEGLTVVGPLFVFEGSSIVRESTRH